MPLAAFFVFGVVSRLCVSLSLETRHVASP